jgi:hypothetical protein
MSLLFTLRTEGPSPWNFFPPSHNRRYNNTRCSKCIKQFPHSVSVSITTQRQVLYPIPFAHITVRTTVRASPLMTLCCGCEPNNRAQYNAHSCPSLTRSPNTGTFLQPHVSPLSVWPQPSHTTATPKTHIYSYLLLALSWTRLSCKST